MKIFSGSSSKSLAQKIASCLKKELSEIEIYVFPDEEKRVRIEERVVGEDCVVVQSTSTNADRNYMELFFVVDALKRSGAKSVTAIIPYLGYQRQDHVFRDGEVVSLQVIIKMLEAAGVDKVTAFDLHSIRIPELFHIPVVHLSALPFFAEKIRELSRTPIGRVRQRYIPAGRISSFVHSSPPNPHLSVWGMVLVSPDMGGIRRTKILSEMLNNIPYVTIEKDRDLASGKILATKVHGVVKKRAVIVDDMISTGSTIVTAANLLFKNGAEEIFVFATHPVFSGNAPAMLQESLVKKVFVTDTIEVPKEKLFPKLTILSVGEMIAEEIKAQALQ